MKNSHQILRAVALILGLGIGGFSSHIYAQEKSASKAKKGKEKIITREAKSKRGNKTKIDFDEASISGEVKRPFGSLINQNKNDKNYDLVKIRLRWHQEMIQSTSSLESDGSR